MDNGLISFAEAYHARASYEEKREAEELYRALRGDDGNVRFNKIRRRFDSWVEKDLRKLDSDGDGALMFMEFLVVFYHSRGVIRINSCGGDCRGKIFGPYFSCKSCLHNFPQTYDLCCRCYREGMFDHDHPLTDFLHDNGRLAFTSMRQEQIHKPKDEMEDMRKIAKLYFQAASPRVQQSARDFFIAMDEDGDQGVDVWEFVSFLSRSGYSHLARKQVFKKLNVSGNGALDFMDVMTLCYIIQSGRPICNGCNVFIPGIFFSCVECFRINPFNICCRCYRKSIRCPHAHARGGGIDFLDNYSLLQTLREAPTVSRGRGHDYDQQHGEPSSSQAIVPVASSGMPGKTKTDVAYAALELAISVSNTLNSIALTAGTSKCTIM